MQMEGLPENNTVLIAGKIVKGCVFSHEVYGEGFYTFQISSERLSDKEDILLALQNGATAVSSTNQGVWNL